MKRKDIEKKIKKESAYLQLGYWEACASRRLITIQALSVVLAMALIGWVVTFITVCIKFG